MNENTKQANYRAIFFDLDGTLLPIHTDDFMRNYMAMLNQFIESHGVERDVFAFALRRGITAMTEHEDKQSNAVAFWDEFMSLVPKSRAFWDEILGDFYENRFNAIGSMVHPNPCAAEAVGLLQAKAYPLVLTTMPMFPLSAVEWRLDWSGLARNVFSRITHYENSTSVKPKLAYYEENLRAGGLEPGDVLLVGNNTKDDLVCMELGMDAYLITDYLINPNGFDLSLVKHGSFPDFVAWAGGLAKCTNPATSFATGLIT